MCLLVCDQICLATLRNETIEETAANQTQIRSGFTRDFLDLSNAQYAAEWSNCFAIVASLAISKFFPPRFRLIARGVAVFYRVPYPHPQNLEI